MNCVAVRLPDGDIKGVDSGPEGKPELVGLAGGYLNFARASAS